MGKATIKKRWGKFIPMIFSNCHANFVLVWAFNVVLKYVYVKLIRYLFVSFGSCFSVKSTVCLLFSVHSGTSKRDNNAQLTQATLVTLCLSP